MHAFDNRGALRPSQPRVRRNSPARTILSLLDDVQQNHGDVIAQLGPDRRKALINVVSARLSNELPDIDAEIADRLVTRTIDAIGAGILV